MLQEFFNEPRTSTAMEHYHTIPAIARRKAFHAQGTNILSNTQHQMDSRKRAVLTSSAFNNNNKKEVLLYYSNNNKILLLLTTI